MRHADQVAYLERMLRMVRTNTRDDGPGLSHTSVEGYFDPAQYRREVDVLFRKHPIVVGHSAQVRKPGDFGAPEDIAYGILYLISDESRFVTGTELVIDGGMNAI